MSNTITGKLYSWDDIKKFPNILDAINHDIAQFETKLGYKPAKIMIRSELPKKLPANFPEVNYVNSGIPVSYWLLYPLRAPRAKFEGQKEPML